MTEEEIDKRIEIVNKFLSIMMPSKFVFDICSGISWNGIKQTHLYKGESIFKAPLQIKKIVLSKGIEVIEENFKNNREYTLMRMEESGLDLSNLQRNSQNIQ